VNKTLSFLTFSSKTYSTVNFCLVFSRNLSFLPSKSFFRLSASVNSIVISNQVLKRKITAVKIFSNTNGCSKLNMFGKAAFSGSSNSGKTYESREIK